MRKTECFHSDRSKSNRWRWLAGSAAATGVAIPAQMDAGTVQITLSNNEVTSNGAGIALNSLSADLTGDGVDDLKSLSALVQTGSPLVKNTYRLFIYVEGVPRAQAGWKLYTTVNSYRAVVYAMGGGIDGNLSGQGSHDIFRSISVQFRDKRINRGALTNGLLEVNLKNLGTTSHAITLVRLIFDDASTAGPAGVVDGGTKPEWVDKTPIERAKLKRKIRAKKKLLRKANRARQKARAKRLKKQVRKLNKELKALC